MKLKSEKPNRVEMQYFTPEAFLNYNSEDAEIAERAEEAWEVAIENYRQHLRKLLPGMPRFLKRLATINLHDWEFLMGLVGIKTVGNKQHATIILRLNQKVVILTYTLWGAVQFEKGTTAWRFTGTPIHWLYDEIDSSGDHPKRFFHRILISDGTTMVIPFETVRIVGPIPFETATPA